MLMALAPPSPAFLPSAQPPDPEPPPDFDIANVKAMILRGETPPHAWWPFVRELDLSYSDELEDLTPLSGLTALQHLDLRDTRVSDLTPLSGLTALQSVTLSTDRRPNGLAALRHRGVKILYP